MLTLILTATYITFIFAASSIGDLIVTSIDDLAMSGELTAMEREDVLTFANWLIDTSVATIALVMVILIILTIGFGFLPIWIALARGHRRRPAIILVNIFLDWTFIGWIVAFILSLTSAKEPKAWER